MPNNKGVDLLIPVRLEDGTFGVLVIQVKNEGPKTNPKKAKSTLITEAINPFIENGILCYSLVWVCQPYLTKSLENNEARNSKKQKVEVKEGQSEVEVNYDVLASIYDYSSKVDSSAIDFRIGTFFLMGSTHPSIPEHIMKCYVDILASSGNILQVETKEEKINAIKSFSPLKY